MIHPDNMYLDALCRNDHLKTKEIYQKCFPAVDKWISQNSGNTDSAKDVFQDVLINLYTRACVKQNFTLTTTICSFLGYASKMKWLKILGQTKNSIFQTLSKEVSIEYKDESSSIEEIWILLENKAERKQKLQKSFEQLSKKCQELLLLDIKGFNTEEIIHLMNYSNRNVLDASKSRCYRNWRDLYYKLDS